jgi:hypothetical protein
MHVHKSNICKPTRALYNFYHKHEGNPSKKNYYIQGRIARILDSIFLWCMKRCKKEEKTSRGSSSVTIASQIGTMATLKVKFIVVVSSLKRPHIYRRYRCKTRSAQSLPSHASAFVQSYSFFSSCHCATPAPRPREMICYGHCFTCPHALKS